MNVFKNLKKYEIFQNIQLFFWNSLLPEAHWNILGAKFVILEMLASWKILYQIWCSVPTIDLNLVI